VPVVAFLQGNILWKSVSYLNILDLIAVEIDNYTGKCSMISELMTNGNVVSFIRTNAVNRLRLVIDLLLCSSLKLELISPSP